MSRPVSLAVKPPGVRAKWNAPSQRMFADDSDEEGDAFGSASSRPKAVKVEDERIEGFGNGRALGSRRSPEPLVIAPLPNRDWRTVATQSRRPGYRPERRDEGPVVTHERTGEEPQRRGLRRAGDIDPDYDRKPDAAALAAVDAKPRVPKQEVKEEEERKPLTLEEEALAAVLAGDAAPVSDAQRRAEELVIESAANRNIMSEEQALERDLNILPPESSLDDYDAVPVEAFGAAMLRGMGYNPKDDTPMHVPKPRPALLGIGATALSSELPPSRKDPKKRREERATRGGRGFNAAALLVPSNGPSREASTARELSGEATASRGASPGEKRRRDDDDGRDSKRRYDDRDRERERSRRSERDRDDRDRRRDQRYETDEERARRKARERERDRDRDDRRDRDRDRDRDRERSRRDDRDRYDDRDRRDRDRDRDRR
ncbi:hypothetical protein CC85DRAFT_283615 [Cutaneotrichosporon oleaginosum]|uniref:Spp2/MOS2 G-patch domain-containing protein n=1 Tax=Cutaneotrichosporon oleaginosum TaxID=879819 RepID=A0A0J1B988_9TREE|nr:uncharacterized protein CC85DRAFT_283615 [Cutaneotrichosporon oleaginosum]KLT44374.1 hypothetical protein CC85DRAFT_283615 [Cutaneotrichosporon oleaginosum]TXT07902.1 hypothetical protein COLE_04826 [Cutaneotrichosporon oleaginosum]